MDCSYEKCPYFNWTLGVKNGKACTYTEPPSRCWVFLQLPNKCQKEKENER